MRSGDELPGVLRRVEEACRDGFGRWVPNGGAEWVGRVLARRDRGEVQMAVWEVDPALPAGCVVWEPVPGVGRRVILAFLEPNHRSPGSLGEMLRAFEEFEPLVGPAFLLPDAIPDLALEEQSACLEPAGWVHFDRMRMVFGPGQEVPGAPLQKAWQFRSLQSEDGPEMLELTCRAYRDYPGQLEWTHVDLERDLIEYADLLRSPAGSVVADSTFVVRVEGAIRGSVVTRRDASGTYVHSLQVDPRWHGRGLGRALLVRALTSLRDRGPPQEVWLRCLRQNERAVALYRSVGFHAASGPRDLGGGYWVRRKTLRAVLARPGNEKFR